MMEIILLMGSSAIIGAVILWLWGKRSNCEEAPILRTPPRAWNCTRRLEDILSRSGRLPNEGSPRKFTTRARRLVKRSSVMPTAKDEEGKAAHKELFLKQKQAIQKAVEEPKQGGRAATKTVGLGQKSDEEKQPAEQPCRDKLCRGICVEGERELFESADAVTFPKRCVELREVYNKQPEGRKAERISEMEVSSEMVERLLRQSKLDKKPMREDEARAHLTLAKYAASGIDRSLAEYALDQRAYTNQKVHCSYNCIADSMREYNRLLQDQVSWRFRTSMFILADSFVQGEGRGRPGGAVYAA
jgi:hypothetical protein